MAHRSVPATQRTDCRQDRAGLRSLVLRPEKVCKSVENDLLLTCRDHLSLVCISSRAVAAAVWNNFRLPLGCSLGEDAADIRRVQPRQRRRMMLSPTLASRLPFNAKRSVILETSLRLVQWASLRTG